MDVSITVSDAIGTIKMHHTFNGAAPVPRGWFPCTGTVINQTNYDAYHGSGAYSRDGVATSPLLNKYAPSFVGAYPVGATNTTQNGSSGITTVGNSGHNVTPPTHSHKWYLNGDFVDPDYTYDSAGSQTGLTGRIKDTTTAGEYAIVARDDAFGSGSFYTPTIAGSVLYTSKDTSAAFSIQPESIEVLFLVKVV